MSLTRRSAAWCAALVTVLATMAWVPSATAAPALAVQPDSYCSTSTLAANDDGSTGPIAIPFALKFFGTPYDHLFVNNNGNLTFSSSRSTYTPSDITGNTGVPIIAPFFADVDTRGSISGGNTVSYGVSPDGKSLCALWTKVGYYSSHVDKVNTFQVVLTSDTVGAGRVAGDFDITFNYDQVQWEAGDLSGGTGGLGGTSAVVGFSAGTGQTGTFVQLPGSLTPGALLDGGPSSLVAGHQGSSQPGRYIFPVLNSGLASSLGGVTGTVVRASDASPVADAYVQICSTGGGCSYTTTDATGTYDFSALNAGTDRIEVWPPDTTLFSGTASVQVVGGSTTTVDPIALEAPRPLPGNVTITNNGVSAAGVPSVYYGDPISLTVHGCAGIAHPTYTVTLADGTLVRDHVALTEASPGTYTATIAPFYPIHGDAIVTTDVPATCGGDPTEFNLYIDPSGTVTDQYGRPLATATVTLQRADTSAGPFADVADGSAIMSPSNRANPSTTDASGQFAWDVQVGWYVVRATHAGCTDGATPPLQVPPAQLDLVVRLVCSVAAPAPIRAAGLSGTPVVGQTLTVVPATWPAPLTSQGTRLLRNGRPVALSQGRYTLKPGDFGALFTTASAGQRPTAVPPESSANRTTFTAVTSTSAGLRVRSAASATALRLKAATVKHTKHGAVSITVSVRGVTAPLGRVVVKDGRRTVKTVSLTSAGRGRVTITLPKLKKGTHLLVATYQGTTGITASTSAKVKLTVT